MYNSKDISIVQHMKECCENIRSTINRFGNSYEVFLQDLDYRNSVSMSIMQIGELTGNLSEDFKKQTGSEIPWRLIKGMRNHFAHGYAYMEKKDIFETATQDVPFLEQKFEHILQDYEISKSMEQGIEACELDEPDFDEPEMEMDF